MFNFWGIGYLNGFLDAASRPQVKLDALNMGLDAVIVKNGTRVCGTGAVLGTAAIMQDKAYFEGTSQLILFYLSRQTINLITCYVF